MTGEEATKILSLHMMQCGMLMPIEWVKKNGEGSQLHQAVRMAIDALTEKNDAVDFGYLYDWFIHSVRDEPPVWTEEHIDELLESFIVIPKTKVIPEPLTIEEIRKMHEQPVWCESMGCWGIVTVEEYGQWAGVPFLLGHQGCQFNFNIESRGLVVYRMKPAEGGSENESSC